MSAIDAFINDGDDDVPVALSYIPCLRGSDQVHAVELSEGWIIRRYIDTQNIVWLRIQHIIARIERSDCFERVARGHVRNAETFNQIRAFEAINLDGDKLNVLSLQCQWRVILPCQVQDGLSF